MSTHPQTRSGQCQCGRIVYRLKGEPLTFYLCHCRDCQKQASSAFGMSLWVARENFELVQGELKIWKTAGGTGAVKICAFCETCGSRIYHASSGPSDPLSIKAGTLDDAADLMPVAELWTKRAHPWVRIDSGHCLRFEDEPESDEVLMAQWRRSRDPG